MRAFIVNSVAKTNTKKYPSLYSILKSSLLNIPRISENKLPPHPGKLSYCYSRPSRGARATVPMLSGTPPIDRSVLRQRSIHTATVS